MPEATVESMKAQAAGALGDARGRPLHDLRISVTDRCNFRCVYCMPKEIFGRDFVFRERSELLSFEEIERLARISVSLGVTKLRLTGGEPLLRRGIVDLVSMLSKLKTPEGQPVDLAMTTNGSALPVMAQKLKDAGLRRVTISLDSLDDEKFKAINDVDFPVSRVLHAIDVAQEVGLGPVKINTVVKRGVNDSEILSLAEHFRGTGAILRFIEYMDVGTTNGWKLDEVLPSSEVVAMVNKRWALEPVSKTEPGETANRWRYTDGAGEIGVISSVTNAFCGNCSRARVSAEGQLYTCLFAGSGYDLRALMRDGISDEDLAKALTGHWRKRDDNYSELRAALTPGNRKRIEMSYIGG
ncbi:cyclic pyranopterin phosphate synthase MoaA [Arthrobacter sp. W1]|nr:cyclic pyranopterin phosphate synthase MoaA [Arthrobacter sp. W1]